MAETKKTKAEEKVETPNTEAPKTNEEPKVKIKLPRLYRDKNDDLFVSVNEKTYLIQRGVEVEVPISVAEVIEHAEQAQEDAYLYEQDVRN